MKEKIHHPKARQDILGLLQAEKIEEVFHYLELYRNSLCEEGEMGRLLLSGKSVSILPCRMGLILQILLRQEYLYLSRHGQVSSALKMKLHTGEL